MSYVPLDIYLESQRNFYGNLVCIWNSYLTLNLFSLCAFFLSVVPDYSEFSHSFSLCGSKNVAAWSALCSGVFRRKYLQVKCVLIEVLLGR